MNEETQGEPSLIELALRIMRGEISFDQAVAILRRGKEETSDT